MDAEELRIVTECLTTATERIADAVARAVGDAVRATMPTPLPDVPISTAREYTADDVHQLMRDAADPTDEVDWLADRITATPTANMGPGVGGADAP